MAAGLLDSDYITTVSPNYMEEIKTEDYGCSLSDIIRKREESSRGIINGIDYDEWNPEKDGNINGFPREGIRQVPSKLLEVFQIIPIALKSCPNAKATASIPFIIPLLWVDALNGSFNAILYALIIRSAISSPGMFL